MIKKIGDCKIDTLYGKARLVSYKDKNRFSFALIFGKVEDKKDVFCRVHSACFTSESLFATNCDCREQLIKALEICRQNGGLIIYLQQEGRGNGIEAKIEQMQLEYKKGPKSNKLLPKHLKESWAAKSSLS